MSRKPDARLTVVIRADASPQIGGGHVSRCLVLAAKLADAGASVAFWSNRGAVDLCPGLADFDLLPADDGDTAPRALFEKGCDLLIVDSYDWRYETEHACRSWARTVAVIDDRASVRRDADILINPNAGFSADDYAGLVAAEGTVLAGADYALVKEAFTAARGPQDPVGPASNMLVCFGAGAQDAAWSVAYSVLDRLAGTSRVHIVDPGGAYESRAVPSAWTVERYCADMVSALGAVDLAIGGGGVSLWERCALGIPSVTVILAENQKRAALAAERAGATWCLDMTGGGYDETVLSQALSTLMSDAEARREMSRRCLALCDGAGAARVADTLIAASMPAH